MVFIVSEIGVNWDGDFELLRNMMKNSKTVGCDAIKLQAFSEENISQHPKKEKLLSCSINSDNVKRVNRIANELSIEWFCTPMYDEAIEFLDPYVSKYKIRQIDGIHLLENKETDLIKKILKTGKQVFVSSQKNPKKSQFFSYDQISWLYCVPKYPCAIEEIDFKNISNFDGYSNHCPDILAPLIAVKLGAEIIEIHTTIDKSKDYFDNNVSFNFSELDHLIKLIRKVEKITK